jgi:hypothetical protein
MVRSAVPDFFQEETADALRAQVGWFARELGVEDAFFEKVLGTDEVTSPMSSSMSFITPPPQAMSGCSTTSALAFCSG